MKGLKGYVTRSFIWSVLFYLPCIAAVCLLDAKDTVKGAQTLLIFAPLLFLAFSTESFSKLVTRKLRAFGICDFCLKTAAFVFLMLPYGFKGAGRLFALRIAAVCVAFAASVAIEIITVKLYDRYAAPDESQPVACSMSLKELGRLSIFCFLGTFFPLWGGAVVLLIGYNAGSYIVGLPLIAVGLFSLIMRTVILLRRGKEFARLPKTIVDAVLIVVTVILSLTFTTAKIVETDGGFTVENSGSVWGTAAFAVLYIATLVVVSHTNRKMAVTYLKMRNKMQNDDLF